LSSEDDEGLLELLLLLLLEGKDPPLLRLVETMVLSFSSCSSSGFKRYTQREKREREMKSEKIFNEFNIFSYYVVLIN
jgi:hypothetical protein